LIDGGQEAASQEVGTSCVLTIVVPLDQLMEDCLRAIPSGIYMHHLIITTHILQGWGSGGGVASSGGVVVVGVATLAFLG